MNGRIGLNVSFVGLIWPSKLPGIPTCIYGFGVYHAVLISNLLLMIGMQVLEAIRHGDKDLFDVFPGDHFCIMQLLC